MNHEHHEKPGPSTSSASDSNANMQWMYEGTKSLVNREDYLLGKKIDKNFELFSDVVIKDKEEDEKDEFLRQSLLKRVPAANQKISALDVRVVRNEDPLVALKFQEEQRRRQMLENPLLKLKAQRVLRKALEKELKREMRKEHKKKDKKKKHHHKHRSRSSSSSSSRNSSISRRDERNRRTASKDPSPKKDANKRREHRERDQERKRRDPKKSRSRSPIKNREEGKKMAEKTKNINSGKTRSKSPPPSQRNQQQQQRTKVMSAEELEERRKAMLENAVWREEQREQNFRMAAQQLNKEEAESSNHPSFMKPLLNSATSTSSLEKRLQSNRMNIQRTHDHMEKSFARK